MKVINLTPHDLNMVEGAVYPRTEVEPGRFLTIRAAQETEEVGTTVYVCILINNK